MAVEWAGQEPTPLPPQEMSPSEAHSELWNLLRGQGVQTRADEDHAWSVEPSQVLQLGHLLAHVARYSGRVTLAALPDGKIRLGLDSGRMPRVQGPDEIRGTALSLSQQQERMVAALRESHPAGLEVANIPGDYRTLESLVRYGLAVETESEMRDGRVVSGRAWLTDAGWRVLAFLGPRSAS